MNSVLGPGPEDCDPKIGVDRALAIYSGMERTWNNVMPIPSGSEAVGMPDAGGGTVSSRWGGSWGVVMEYTLKQCLTHNL